ncbi:MAG TPA: DUF222 domain-containing protein [Jatrophihabitans sp.]|nr:DUF222 domain-containing protein [Jatrophihabitans sp.]
MIEHLTTASDVLLLAEIVELEAEVVRLQYRQLEVLAELNCRNAPTELGFRGLPQLIEAQLRCTRVEARRRAQAVERFGARRGLTGEPLQAQFPAAAKALSVGDIGAEHAAAIAEIVEVISASERAEHTEPVETALLEHARISDPRTMRLLGQRILAHLDPDGPSPDQQRLQQAHRRITLTPLPDGSCLLDGQLSSTCRAIWDAILTPLAAVRADDALGPDQRSIPQRMHDAFEEAGRRLLATKDLPDHAGLPCQLMVTVSLTDLERRAGRATTHHGGTLSIDQALRLAADGSVLPAVLGDAGEVLTLGRGQRLASRGQRKALFARDRGCTFPGCDRSAARSEIHHAIDWATGGRTDLDSMAIACGYHNTEGPKQGWRTIMINGIPHWKPPPWHPQQQPQRNHHHHPELLTQQTSTPPDPG